MTAICKFIHVHDNIVKLFRFGINHKKTFSGNSRGSRLYESLIASSTINNTKLQQKEFKLQFCKKWNKTMYSIYNILSFFSEMHNMPSTLLINTDADGALSFAGTVFKACYIIGTALAGCTWWHIPSAFAYCCQLHHFWNVQFIRPFYIKLMFRHNPAPELWRWTGHLCQCIAPNPSSLKSTYSDMEF